MSKNNGLFIDPCTKDYVMEDGKPVNDTSIGQPIYIRLKAKRKTWLYAPDDNWGSSFHLLKKSNTTMAVTREINTAEKALEPLLDDNRLADLSAEVTKTVRGQVALGVNVVEEVGEDEETILIPIGE